MSGIHLGLENMRILLSYLPPMTTPYIHIAGTNGKGSVSAMLDSCMQVSGIRTGRYNSPHLVTIRDSILVNGEEVSEEEYAKQRELVLEQIQLHNLTNSEFEITTATAYAIFATQEPPLDVLLIECGMGGLRDATNVLPPALQLCSVLTMVDLDHQGFLGNTVEEIAADKCGIMVEGKIMFVGKQGHKGVQQVVADQAGVKGTDVLYAAWEAAQEEGEGGQAGEREVGKAYTKPAMSKVGVACQGKGDIAPKLLGAFPVPLPGAHQLDNTALAASILSILSTLPAAKLLQPKIGSVSSQTIEEGLIKTAWRGRCSWVTVPASTAELEVLVDGAHNPAASSQLRAYVDSCKPSAPTTYILGLSHSPPKTPLQVLQPLLKAGDRVAVVEFSLPIEGMPWIKPVPKTSVLEAVKECGVREEDVAPEEVPSLDAALKWAAEAQMESEQGLVVVTGSLYLVADVYRLCS